MFVKKITKEEINELPLSRYTGKVIIVSKAEQIAKAIYEIRQYDVIGFDTETRPTFRKGQPLNPVALLQVAIPGKVFLFRLNHLGLPDEICELFSDFSIRKVGVGIRDDILDLQKLKPFDAVSFVDLNSIAKELEVSNAGVRNLSGIFLRVRISKNAQTSNWESEQLSEKQIRYAATDAWVCLEIYQKLLYWGYV